jgi:pimeloyl-ACP methyl ester carboxylesterase
MLGKSIVSSILLTTYLTCAAIAQTSTFPGFRAEMVPANGVELYTRVGGKGPTVVLIHGFGDTGDMWAPLAADLAKDHTVIVPDLRGMGLSSIPPSGYEKRNQAADIRGLLDRLGVGKADIVGHDIGTMVAYAYAARYPEQTTKLVVMDAPVPGVPPWDEIVRDPRLWHFDFGGPDMERLVRGRERIYLDRFWNEFAGTPSKIDEATRRHYARLYARPEAMRAAFAQFRSIRQDAADNKAELGKKLPMPVLAIGGAQSFGAMEAVVMRNAAVDVTEVVIPHAGHWLMEEATQPTIEATRTFLDPDPSARTSGEKR